MGLQKALEDRRGDVERSRAMDGGFFVVEGFHPCVGTGEATVDVTFPVKFYEMPIPEGGGMVGENEVIVPGSFPEWQVGVLRWELEKNHIGNLLYVGAQLVIVVHGQGVGFRSIAWWRMTGRALTNPVVGGL
jgi:hypothetical protein